MHDEFDSVSEIVANKIEKDQLFPLSLVSCIAGTINLNLMMNMQKYRFLLSCINE
ncbi:transmembrane protein, putative (macronuclear) [Tetrahymena thermophila SB210]|uniref:Transmembrane protein, putative n=1 Tax=Tetrahymena thermophila (strain SB210) TaxID=312017 RepID=I7ML59_TETTS|nr:transmembrane protein, putative [Tetrahymena thermophila SB210]EAS01221.1 transmembrane protein, putative [Tetrahymena thermophila SB210]|eukprot:XP_001021466.1 transmembrane protein, putative [Tetrahymena thermophila SB210]